MHIEYKGSCRRKCRLKKHSFSGEIDWCPLLCSFLSQSDGSTSSVGELLDTLKRIFEKNCIQTQFMWWMQAVVAPDKKCWGTSAAKQGWRQGFSDGGLTLPMRGPKYCFQSTNAKNLRKNRFSPSDGGYSPLALLWHHPYCLPTVIEAIEF